MRPIPKKRRAAKRKAARRIGQRDSKNIMQGLKSTGNSAVAQRFVCAGCEQETTGFGDTVSDTWGVTELCVCKPCFTRLNLDPKFKSTVEEKAGPIAAMTFLNRLAVDLGLNPEHLLEAFSQMPARNPDAMDVQQRAALVEIMDKVIKPKLGSADAPTQFIVRGAK